MKSVCVSKEGRGEHEEAAELAPKLSSRGDPQHHDNTLTTPVALQRSA